MHGINDHKPGTEKDNNEKENLESCMRMGGVLPGWVILETHFTQKFKKKCYTHLGSRCVCVCVYYTQMM